jgi:hypothetical protein
VHVGWGFSIDVQSRYRDSRAVGVGNVIRPVIASLDEDPSVKLGGIQNKSRTGAGSGNGPDAGTNDSQQ